MELQRSDMFPPWHTTAKPTPRDLMLQRLRIGVDEMQALRAGAC